MKKTQKKLENDTVYYNINKGTLSYKRTRFVPKGYVDLDLPSGTLWMQYNIGATKETENGKYFQWGDTVGYTDAQAKAHSEWSTTPFNFGSSYSKTYFASVSGDSCPNGVLSNEYDPCFAATNGDAVLPTEAQITELYGQTNVTIETNGTRFTSLKDETKSMFVPFSGYYYLNNYYQSGQVSYLWSKNLDMDAMNKSKCLSNNKSGSMIYSNMRCYGLSARGVLKK